ncbi:MAG: ATP-binding protein, partial [Candidatus Dormibacteraceae bacterium]
MSRKAYRSRVVDEELALLLNATGAVLIEGPRACGKTVTARRVASSEVLLDLDVGARQAVAVDPGLVLDGPTPRLIDEWQIEPAIWNHVRRAVDDRATPGQFILAGSAIPTDDITRHTGAGRIARLRMRPMTLFETGHSTGDVAFSRLMAGEPARSSDPGLTISEIAERIVVGGWPGLLSGSLEGSLRTVRDYLEEIYRFDISRVDDTQRDPERVARLLRSLARNLATYTAATTLAADTGGAEGPLDDDTVRSYLSALARLMVVEDQPAWGTHLRSRSVMR